MNPASARVATKVGLRYEKDTVRPNGKTMQVFGVSWIGSKSFGLFFKLPKEKAQSIVISGITPHRYEEEWKQVLYKIESPEKDTRRLLPLFEAAFKHITGIEDDG